MAEKTFLAPGLQQKPPLGGATDIPSAVSRARPAVFSHQWANSVPISGAAV
jgi:hypothetical protein